MIVLSINSALKLRWAILVLAIAFLEGEREEQKGIMAKGSMLLKGTMPKGTMLKVTIPKDIMLKRSMLKSSRL